MNQHTLGIHLPQIEEFKFVGKNLINKCLWFVIISNFQNKNWYDKIHLFSLTLK